MPPELRRRIIVIICSLIAFSAVAWLWALVEFHNQLSLLGIALVVYGLGLRHAVDADHIAAIDNVTRKLMNEGQRPVGVGFFFALGHSLVVILAVAGIAVLAEALSGLKYWQNFGDTVSTLFSAFFLFAIAAMNLVILFGIVKSYRKLQAGQPVVEQDMDLLLNNRGFLARIFRPVFKLVTSSWHMIPVGFLFGLGFDTATEVATFGLAASQAAKGLPLDAVLVFPILFAAGMTLVDTADGVMMLSAYHWAFLDPMRKLFYNMTITLVSIVVAVLIGGIETLGVIGDHYELKGGFWDGVGTLNDNFGTFGFAIVGVFAVAWLVSYIVYKSKVAPKLAS